MAQRPLRSDKTRGASSCRPLFSQQSRADHLCYVGARKSSLINSTIRIRSCKVEVVAEGLSTTVGIAEQAQVRRLAAPYPQPDHYGPYPDTAGAGDDHALCESERVVLCLLYTGKFCVHCSVCAHNRALCHGRCRTLQTRSADPPDVESFNRDQNLANCASSSASGRS